MLDAGAPQPQVNERVAGLLENHKKDLERIGTDHEKRIRYLERTVAWALGGIGAISGMIMLVKAFVK